MIWKILSILSLAVPVAMVALGLILWRCPPKGPNWLLGFRSRRARASDEVWAFAQDLAGKIWFCLGLSLLFAALLVCNGQRDADIEESLTTYLWLIGGQVIALVVVILTVNIVLLCKFDRFGRRRQKGAYAPADQDMDPGYEISTDEPADTWDEYGEEDGMDGVYADEEFDEGYNEDLPEDEGGYEE